MKRIISGILVLFAILALVGLGHGFTHPRHVKARAQRVNTVNSLRSVSLTFTLTNTNSAASAPPVRPK